MKFFQIKVFEQIQSKNITYAVLLSLTLLSLLYLYHGFSNLVSGSRLPVDLALRYWQTKQLIFEHINIYSNTAHAQYPPSFYLFLSSIIGIVRYQHADIVWAIVNILSLFNISYYLFWNKSLKNRFILPLLFLTFHSIPHGLGVGQVHILIVATLIGFLWIYEKPNPSIFLQIIGILFLSISLGKYSLLLPFAIIFLLNDTYRIPIIIAILLNLILSQLVLTQVNSSIPEYIQLILKNSSKVNTLGTIDVQFLATTLGLPSFMGLVFMLITLTSFVVLIIYFRPSLSIQLALAAVTARFFIYHAHYDNVILLFVLIALIEHIDVTKFQEVLVCMLLWISVLLPARYLEWNVLWGLGLWFQVIVWILSIVYLLKKSSEMNRLVLSPNVKY